MKKSINKISLLAFIGLSLIFNRVQAQHYITSYPGITICYNATVNLVINAGSGTTCTWSSSVIGTLISTSGASVNTHSLTMNTIFKCVVDSSGIIDSSFITITVLPRVTVSGPVSICGPTSTIGTMSTTLTAGSTSSFSWAPAFGLSATNIANPVASPSTTTTYTVTGSDPSSSGTCYSTATVLVTVNSLTANLSTSVLGTSTTTQSRTLCPGTSVINFTGSAVGASVFSWNSTSGISVIGSGSSTNANVSVSGTVLVTVYNAGCSDTASVNLVVSAPPASPTASPSTICSGSTSSLSSPLGWTYDWDHGNLLNDSTIANPNATPTITTTFNVVLSNGGCTFPSSVTVTVNPSPIVSAGTSTNICSGNSTVLNGSGAANYSWAPASGLSSTSVSNPNANPTSTTTYTLTGQSSAGCYGTASVVVNVQPVPTVSVSSDIIIHPDTVCSGTSVVLTASGTATSYTWSGPNLSATTGSVVTATPISSFSGIVNYIVVGVSAGCSTTTTANKSLMVNVNNDGSPTLVPHPSKACVGYGDISLLILPASVQVYCPDDSSALVINGVSGVRTFNTTISGIGHYNLGGYTVNSFGCHSANAFATIDVYTEKSISSVTTYGTGYLVSGNVANTKCYKNATQVTENFPTLSNFVIYTTLNIGDAITVVPTDTSLYGCTGHYIYGTNGIEELMNEENTRMYPNPMSNSATVELPKKGNYTIQISNLLGQVEKSFKIDSEKFTVSDLKQGIYFLNISSDSQKYSMKFLVTE